MLWKEFVQDNYSQYTDSGIYGIFVDGVCLYVGQSSNIYKRWIAHARHIDNYILGLPDKELRGKTLEKYMCLAGCDLAKVQFKVLELCAISDLNPKELEWIKNYKPKLNFSMTPYKGRR